VGCGRPTFLRALVKAAGWHGTGIDTSDAGWRDDGAGAWAGLDLRVGRVEDADFDPGSFHLVTLWHVLEHVPAPRPFLERLHDVTGPGGVLVVEVPDHASLARRLQGESWIGYDTPRHAVAYEPGTLNRMLAETGWRVKQLRRWGTLDPWVLWWLGRQVGRGRTLEGPLEKDFLPFLAGKILTWPVAALQRWLPLGAMTAVARRRDD
jgi:2-polyprenyl-3-methyl-5-hydroxy-6-metoxy-1,4-benzoquinol methylase